MVCIGFTFITGPPHTEALNNLAARFLCISHSLLSPYFHGQYFPHIHRHNLITYDTISVSTQQFGRMQSWLNIKLSTAEHSNGQQRAGNVHTGPRASSHHPEHKRGEHAALESPS